MSSMDMIRTDTPTSSPLEAMKYLASLTSRWQANVTKANDAYIQAGCKCNHIDAIETYMQQLEGIQMSYTEIIEYVARNEAEVNNAALALHHTTKKYKEAVWNHKRDERRMITQIKHCNLQQKCCEMFKRHYIKAFKRHKVDSLARCTAAFGAHYRFALEQRAAKCFAKDFLSAEGHLDFACTELEEAEALGLKARKHAAFVEQVKRDVLAAKTGIQEFLILEESRIRASVRSLLESQTQKVAKEGLQILICTSCDGYRWWDDVKDNFQR